MDTHKNAKSILKRFKYIDSWFLAKYSLNLYRGCQHNCVYCDGRNEKYNVNGDFGTNIEVKINANELLKKELHKYKTKYTTNEGYLCLGGGISDAYQSAEIKYKLTQNLLEQTLEYNFPIHILTKSTLVLRDIDLLKKINIQKSAIVSFSFSSTIDEISNQFEPGVPLSSERLKAMAKLRNKGISTGAFLMPVLPFITDSEEFIFKTIKDLKEHGCQYIIFGGLTLKVGRQKDYYLNFIKRNYPSKFNEYLKLYGTNKYGEADYSYYLKINKIFFQTARFFNIPIRIPINNFNHFMNENSIVQVLIDYLNYLAPFYNIPNPYKFAIQSIRKSKIDFTNMFYDFSSLKGIGSFTEKIIKEILSSKSSKYIEKLLYYK